MGNSLVTALATTAITILTNVQGLFSAPPPPPPVVLNDVAETTLPIKPTYPVRVSIPAIELSAPIEYVGINDKGEMAVPNGKTDNVGWYQRGTIPGEIGSAVLAAHVYAAFDDLKDVAPGSDIYIETTSNQKLHFVVEEVTDYRLADLTSSMLFDSRGDKRLNLITCSGTYVPSLGTYDGRVVVSARLVHDSLLFAHAN